MLGGMFNFLLAGLSNIPLIRGKIENVTMKDGIMTNKEKSNILIISPIIPSKKLHY